MAEWLFAMFALASALDVVSMGLTAAFLDRRWSLPTFALRFVVSAGVSMLFALGGLAIGRFGTAYLDGQTATWFAASLMFLLSVKMVYDGLKTARIKRTINPTAISGLLTLSCLTGINVFIYTIGFGLLNLGYKAVMWYAPLFFVALLVAGIAGAGQKRLHHIYNCWILAALALFGALLTIYNNQL